jgi:hypothetical protein
VDGDDDIGDGACHFGSHQKKTNIIYINAAAESRHNGVN